MPLHSAIAIRELDTQAEVNASQRLRYTVWQAEGAVIQPNFEIIAEHHDDHAMHWGAFDGEQLVGSARLCLHNELGTAPDSEMFVGVDLPTPISSMNRLVVLQTHRGQGIGRKLDEVRIERAKRMGAQATIVAPIDIASRRRGLTKLGFQFIDGRVGRSIWSTDIAICACYVILDQTKADNK